MGTLELSELSGEGLDLSARGVDLRSWPAVVVEAAEPPEGATPLGGNYWRVPTLTPLRTAQALIEAGAVDAFPDLVRTPSRFWNDEYAGGQWYLDELEMDALFARSTGSASVRLSVVDSGIDIAHPDLAAKVTDPYDAWSDDEDPSPDPGEYCSGASSDICDDHGTAVSGISAAIGDNGVGIVGMCPECTLIPIKLLGEGNGALSAEVAAYEHARAADAWVINNSWGYTSYTPAPRLLSKLIEEVATENRGGLGAVVVFAAGNDNREILDDELNALPHVLCVSATDIYDNPTNYTNFGDPIDVAAPSATVSIAPEEGITTSFGGTSAAAPVVAGLAGWLLSVRPELTADEVTELIVSTAVQPATVKPDENGHSTYFGYGVIDPLALLAALEEPSAPVADSGEAHELFAGGGGCSSTGAGPWAALGLLAPVLLLGRRR